MGAWRTFVQPLAGLLTISWQDLKQLWQRSMPTCRGVFQKVLCGALSFVSKRILLRTSAVYTRRPWSHHYLAPPSMVTCISKTKRHRTCVVQYFWFLFMLLPLFKKMKVGLCYLCIPLSHFWMTEPIFMKSWNLSRTRRRTSYIPPISLCAVSKQRLGKNVTTAKNTNATTEEFLEAPFYMRSVSYLGKQVIIFPELVLIINHTRESLWTNFV
jgi:hypothetical protein